MIQQRLDELLSILETTERSMRRIDANIKGAITILEAHETIPDDNVKELRWLIQRAMMALRPCVQADTVTTSEPYLGEEDDSAPGC